MRNLLSSKIIITLLIFAVSSCGITNQEYPVRDFYTLDIGKIENNSSRGDEDLKIMRVRLNPKYYSQDFNYKLKENKFVNDYHNQFYKPLDTMVISELYKSLTSSGIFNQVYPQNSIINTKYFLYSNIIDIYADFSQDVPKSVLNIEFLLTHESGQIVKTLHKYTYNSEIELDNKLPDAIVKGWNQNLIEIFNQFQGDLAELPEFK